MIWESKEDGRSPVLTLSNAAKALHTSHPVFLADEYTHISLREENISITLPETQTSVLARQQS